jgi:hypothetical protein
MTIVKKYLKPLLIDYQLYDVRKYETWELTYKSYKVSIETQKPNIVVSKNTIPINNFQFKTKTLINETQIKFDNLIKEDINKKLIKLSEYGFFVGSQTASHLSDFYINVEDGTHRKTQEQILNFKDNKIKVESKITTFNTLYERHFIDVIPEELLDTKRKIDITKFIVGSSKLLVNQNIARINIIESSKLNYHIIPVYLSTQLEQCPTCKKLGEYSFVVSKDYDIQEDTYTSPQSLQDTYGNPTLELNVPVGFDVVIFRIPSETIKIKNVKYEDNENNSDVDENVEFIIDMIDNSTLIGKFVIPNKIYKFEIELNNGQLFELIVKTVNTTMF